MRSTKTALAALLFSGAVVGAVLVLRPLSGTTETVSDKKVSQASLAQEQRSSIDQLYTLDPKSAEIKYRVFVETHRRMPDPHVQDEVSKAELRLGYLAAKRKDFKEARRVFQATAKGYQGSGAMGVDFGGIPDQASYQAAVCLMAEGKTAEARQAFVDFLRQYQLSPLVHAAYKRLQKLGGGNESEKYDLLLQSAIGAQEKHIKFESSV